MLRSILMGAAAGAVGTVALNVSTYLDITIRGRPSSDVPAKTAEKLSTAVGLPLAPTGHSDSKEEQELHEQQGEQRKRGLGALLGYVAGLGVGTVYGAVRPYLGDAPLPVTGIALAAAAMAAGDLPSVLTGSTDPRTWGASGWVADLVPHLAYGFVTALAYEAFTGGELGRRPQTTAKYLGRAARHSYVRLRG